LIITSKSYAQELSSPAILHSRSWTQPASKDADYKIEKKMNEFAVLGGISFDSPTVIGVTPNARFGIISLRYGRVLAASHGVAFQYTANATPIAVLSFERFTLIPTGSSGSNFILQKSRQSVYGAGISPIGFKLNFRPQSRVQPFVSTSGGFLYFSKRIPVSDATRFNFTFEFGGGVQIFTRPRRAITLGYRFQHISNGGMSNVNPGVDANVFYTGFSFYAK
jgi:hypothetical protein